jgi:hypothetical protein
MVEYGEKYSAARTGDEMMAKEVSLEEATRCAESDPILEGMIRRGVPLTRGAYLIQAGLRPGEDGWTAEHEEQVPECFRESEAVEAPSARKGGRIPD